MKRSFEKQIFDCMEGKSEIFETFANLKSVPYRHLPIPSEITHKLLFTWDDHLSSLQGARYLQYIFYFHFSKIYFQWISSPFSPIVPPEPSKQSFIPCFVFQSQSILYYHLIYCVCCGWSCQTLSGWHDISKGTSKKLQHSCRIDMCVQIRAPRDSYSTLGTHN